MQAWPAASRDRRATERAVSITSSTNKPYNAEACFVVVAVAADLFVLFTKAVSSKAQNTPNNSNHGRRNKKARAGDEEHSTRQQRRTTTAKRRPRHGARTTYRETSNHTGGPGDHKKRPPNTRAGARVSSRYPAQPTKQNHQTRASEETSPKTKEASEAKATKQTTRPASWPRNRPPEPRQL